MTATEAIKKLHDGYNVCHKFWGSREWWYAMGQQYYWHTQDPVSSSAVAYWMANHETGWEIHKKNQPNLDTWPCEIGGF